METYEQFTEVYSISDLHLAEGEFVDDQATTALASTIRELIERAKGLSEGRAALVVNGDAVDFLNLRGAAYFDPHGAPEKLQRVFDANKEVWDAFAAFAQAGTLVFTLGNHDIELGLPHCQAMLRRRMTPRIRQGDQGGSLILAFDGAGYRCEVGGANALFLHGNNEDPWNLVDFDLLGRVGAAINAGVAPERWEPNDGTRLVIEVLNAQKAEHPFVDYVKPETFWLLELVAKLGFGSLAAQLAELGPRQFEARRRYRVHQRSPQSAYLGSDLGERAAGATLFDGNQLLRRADELYRQGARVLGSETAAGQLGRGDLLRRGRAENAELRKHVLSSLRGDTSFLPNQSDDTYGSLGPKIGREIHWVVCGHTHLRRAFRERSDRAYFNSGTWMRLMDLYAPSEASDQTFEQVLKALDAKTAKELDAIHWQKGAESVPIVTRQATVVVLADGSGWLEEWNFDANQPQLVPVANAESAVKP